MLIPYIRPQHTITQIFRRNAVASPSRRNPLVVGPQYELFLNDGRPLASEVFSAAGESDLDYRDGAGAALNLSRRSVDLDSAKLFGRDLYADVANFSAGLFDVEAHRAPADLRVLRLLTDNLAGSGLSAALGGRYVRVGDVLRIASEADAASTTIERTVVGLLGNRKPAVAASLLEKSYAPTNAATTNEGAEIAEGASKFADVDFAAEGAPAVLRQRGFLIPVSGAPTVGDVITIEFLESGDIIDEGMVRVRSQATGATVELNWVENTPKFEISLSGLGYTDATLNLTVTGGSVTSGDVLKVRIWADLDSYEFSDAVVGGAYTGTEDRRYVVEFLYTGAHWNIRTFDTAGRDAPSTFVNWSADDSVAIPLGGSGLTITLTDADDAYYNGFRLYVDAVASVVSSVAFDGVLLDGPAVDVAAWQAASAKSVTSVTIFQTYTGELTAENTAAGDQAPLVAGAAAWSYAAGLGLPASVTGRTDAALSPFAAGVGVVILSYKALVLPGAQESLLSLQSVSDITAQLGEIHVENWLAYGAFLAMRGNQGRRTYALRTHDTDAGAFSAALSKVRTTDNVYALAALTDDPDAQAVVMSHCESMSSPAIKNFRRCYVGTDSPGSYQVWGVLPQGGYRTATLNSSILTLGSTEHGSFSAADIGSRVTILALGNAYEILEVLTPDEVLLDAPVELSVAVASGVTMTRPDTAAATAEYVISRSKALSSRRCVNVWTDNATADTANGRQKISNKFLAAEVAGLRCALLPQQGLTMTEITGATAAPGMYTRFSQELLDEIAANGTWVITQESEGGELFVRHQLTTKVDPSLAREYEDNVGVIVDEFSFAKKDRFRGLIGRVNLTPDTLVRLSNILRDIASEFTRTTLQDVELGPMVLTYFNEEGEEGQVTARQDGPLGDSALTYVRLRIPLPLNRINSYVDVDDGEVLYPGAEN
jgi:hypothetical protein